MTKVDGLNSWSKQATVASSSRAYLIKLVPQGEFIIGGDRPITKQACQRTWERINR